MEFLICSSCSNTSWQWTNSANILNARISYKIHHMKIKKKYNERCTKLMISMHWNHALILCDELTENDGIKT
jgi:hypothetical protein